MNKEIIELDTFKKIIENIKEDLHKYIDEPNDENASSLYSSMGSIPYKYKDYEYWNDTDRISEFREYMSMLFQLFEGYFQSFIKEGLRIDDIIENENKRG